VTLKTTLRRHIHPRVWSAMRSLRRSSAIALFRRRDVTHAYGATRLTIHLSDPVARDWYDHDWQLLPEIELLSRGKLRPGATVFDLGAHQGVVALMLAAAVRPEGSVIAVEPDPHNAAAGEKNCALNHGDDVRFVRAAVASRPGVVRFSRDFNGKILLGSSQDRGEEIRAVTIDCLAAEYGSPDVLFVDIEGAECEAFEGAAHTMRSTPDCFVEVHAGCGLEALGGSVEQLLGFFSPTDYDFFAKSEADAEFVPLSTSSPARSERFYLVALSRRSAASPGGARPPRPM
jgi:FkbM family methyltransferase